MDYGDDIFDTLRRTFNRSEIRGSVTIHKGTKPGELQIELNIKGPSDRIGPFLDLANKE